VPVSGVLCPDVCDDTLHLCRYSLEIRYYNFLCFIFNLPFIILIYNSSNHLSGRSLAGIAGSISAGGMDECCVL
jgi:hypothetical protein